MLRYLLVCGLVACPIGAITGRAADPNWEARHSLTAADFEKISKDLAEKGYRPVQISAAVVEKEVRYTAVWEKRANESAVEIRHDLTAKQYETTADELKKKGFRPVEICGYEMTGEARFAAIWAQKPKDAPAREARFDLTSDDYRELYADLMKKEYRPLRLSGYAVEKETRYTTIWEKAPKDAPAWHTRRDLTADQYQEVFTEQVQKGHRLVQVAGYTVDGQERFAGVWEKSPAKGWYGHHTLDTKRYEATMADLKAKGFRPVQVSSYAVDGKPKFAGVWVRE